MPTSTGGETIREELLRLRTDLVRVRRTIERHETNGASFTMGGASVTQIAYERALDRERKLSERIHVLEARVTGSAARPGFAVTRTRME